MLAAHAHRPDALPLQGGSLSAVANEVTAEGEAFASTARGTRHKSAAHSAVVFNLRVEVKFYGRAMVGDSTIGSAAGKITLASAARALPFSARIRDARLREPSECGWMRLGRLALERRLGESSCCGGVRGGRGPRALKPRERA